jgi:hypothetical protein
MALPPQTRTLLRGRERRLVLRSDEKATVEALEVPAAPAALRRERVPLSLVLGACVVLLLVTATLGVGIGSVYSSTT